MLLTMFKSKIHRATVTQADLNYAGSLTLDPDLIDKQYPFSQLKGDANCLIFPDLQSGNISYKLLSKLGGADSVGPILMGMKKPVHVLQRGDDVADIVNMAAVAVVDAQQLSEEG